MTWIYVDATTLIALGTVGELELLREFSGTVVLVPSVRSAVTTEPARANLDRFCRDPEVETTVPTTVSSTASHTEEAQRILGETDTGDVDLVAAVLAHSDQDEQVAVISDDRRVRTVADGLGATVTGTIGVIVRGVEAGLSPDEATAILRRVDSHGLHLTGELRETATDLIDEAASDQ